MWRSYDPDHWVKELGLDYWLHRGNPQQNFYLDDMRFPNEAEALKAEGFRLCQVVPVGTGWNLNEPWRQDTSETSLNEYDHCFHLLSAKGDMKSLYEQLDFMVKNIRGGN